MRRLIDKTANGETARSAKSLYEKLGLNKSHYKKWCERNLLFNEFATYGVDYCSLALGASERGRGNFSSDFALSEEFAKKLAMLTRTDEGEKVRDYFIACEKIAKENIVPSNNLLPVNYLDALKQLVAAEEEKLLLQAHIEEQKPKVEFFDQVTGSKDAINMGEVAKVIGLGIGRNKLFEILRDKKVLMDGNVPYQKYVDCGYFRVIEQKWNTRNGETHVNTKTVVYQKGVDFIIKLLK